MAYFAIKLYLTSFYVVMFQDYILIPSGADGEDIDNLPPPYPLMLNAHSTHSHVTYLTDDSSPLVNNYSASPVIVSTHAATSGYPSTHATANGYPHSFSEYVFSDRPVSHHNSPYVARVTSEYTSDYRHDPVYTNSNGTLPRASLYTPIRSQSPILVGPSRIPHGVADRIPQGSGECRMSHAGFDRAFADMYHPVTSMTHVPVTGVSYAVTTAGLEPVREMPTPDDDILPQQATKV